MQFTCYAIRPPKVCNLMVFNIFTELCSHHLKRCSSLLPAFPLLCNVLVPDTDLLPSRQ